MRQDEFPELRLDKHLAGETRTTAPIRIQDAERFSQKGGKLQKVPTLGLAQVTADLAFAEADVKVSLCF